jgi:DNA helicase IV
LSIIKLTPDQLSIIEAPQEDKIFLEGAAGCGKTTVGVERLLYLMVQGIPASSMGRFL